MKTVVWTVLIVNAVCSLIFVIEGEAGPNSLMFAACGLTVVAITSAFFSICLIVTRMRKLVRYISLTAFFFMTLLVNYPVLLQLFILKLWIDGPPDPSDHSDSVILAPIAAGMFSVIAGPILGLIGIAAVRGSNVTSSAAS